MFCTNCGNQVESSFQFCPHCGFKLCVLTPNVTQDVATSTYQPSVTAEKNQKEDQDQVPKGVKEEQENTTQIKGQSASDDSEAARDGATPQRPSNDKTSPAPLEKGATPSCPNQTVSVNESLTTKNTHVTETCNGKERLSVAAHESNSQSFSNAAPGSNLSVSTALHSPTPASDKKSLLGISREYSPEAVPTAAGLLSNPASSLTSTKEIDSTAPESPGQTPQEWDSVEKQSASNNDIDKTISNERQNLFGRPDDKATYLDSFQGKPASDDSEPARNGVTTQDPSDYTASSAPLEQGTTLSFPNQTEQQTEAPSDINTEDSHTPVQITADKKSGIHSGLSSNSASSPTPTKETGSTAPVSSEQTSQALDSVAKQPLNEQDKDKTISLETENLSGKPDDNKKHTNTEQHTFTKQNDKKEDQAAIDEREAPNARQPEYSHDPCPVTEETSQNTEAVDTKSNKKTNTCLAERQEQQPSNGTVNVSRSPITSCSLGQSDEKAGLLVAVNISGTSPEHQAQQTLPSSGSMHVYFHAVTSKDFHLDPEKDKIFLMSGKLFGDWDKNGQQMSFSRHLGDKRYLVEGRVMIPKNIIHESIPYKYRIWKHNEKAIFEAIYQKDGNQYVNRCLTIKEDFLTFEGEWHQYDDMIHPKLKKSAWPWSSSTKDIVIKGRDLAGRVMLSNIFDLLTTWNEPNVDNFFSLLRQFVYTYSSPVLHDGKERQWGLPYDIKQVEILLKLVLEENINHKPRMQQETTKCLLPFHAGVVSLLIYNKYLKNGMTDRELSSLCDILCLPKKPQHHFSSFWEDFVSPLADKKSVADAVEMFCNKARQHNIDKWVLVIPLIHLLRGESKPFEPVPPVLNPQFDSWTVLRGSKGTHFNRGDYARIMKDHAYLVDIDRLLVYTWMPLLHVDDLRSFISCVQVELLDILHCIQFSVKSGITHSNCMALENLASHLIDRESHRNKRFDDKYGECCLKTAVRLLYSICRHTTDPGLSDVPIYFLDLVCLIAKAYDHTDSQARERIHEESIGETLETMREWRRNTFRNKLLNDWDRTQFSVPHEIKVWDKLLSLSFSHKEHTLFWRTTFMEDFEGKLKREHSVDQIGIYSNKMEELSKTSPLLCSTMEKCALEAVAAICQDHSGRAVSALFKKHDITKFGKLMSVVVLKTWPTDVNGDYTEGEDLIFEYLVNWPMAKTLFQMTGVGSNLINNLSDEVQIRMTLASSAFKSVSEKFLSGEIRMNTLNQILQKEHEFLDLLKIDGLCDDRRCKDDRKMRTLLRQRKEEAEAVHSDKELVRCLLQICQELPQHVKVDFKGLDKKLHQNIEMMNLNTFMKVHTLDEQTSPTIGQVTYFNLCDITRQMATELHAIKDSALFKMCWMNQVEELSRDQPNTDDTEHLDGNEEIYTLE
ncbi:hypothetical protein PFLUV_G00108650 [Perca fluviatilis]|uniref:Zinc-ribbon domain-containing protein n=2 Tax=Perca fluviatilis TaxID=8168 RepID=A0A6A5F8F8_PERFL|nr:hypothetical protein PFLUV_G00108650 [Perca fluviatilis]